MYDAGLGVDDVQESGDSPGRSANQLTSVVEQLKFDNERLKLALTQRSASCLHHHGLVGRHMAQWCNG